ncbi:bile acid:sodium symporter family protein [Persicirhabdus sediminis]|uniref:Bile acid:sodium symporter n=1 Tax=Persicirhabdus sediminis TaxID=454144 RepID=A0A8J7SGW0_9BACT|nr:bile acid:sodium symporter family protein [Persicirhabdus sediminis]MBK1790380.1 bile acid:sodium symporter [Persicirhabdus sediminis]
MTNWLKKEWFLAGMVAAILLAIAFPAPGVSAGPLQLDTITSLGIALIFFLHGIGLSPKAIIAGMSNWRLHLYVQSITFLVYPLIWLICGDGLQAFMPAALAFGFCYLFALPSTISSSVAMTSIARGNVPGAIFNASLSSILGVFITPFLVQLFMGLDGVSMDLSATVSSIAKILILPMILGQLLRRLLLPWLDKRKSIVNKVDKIVILLIVYNAFCDSVAGGIWADFSIWLLAVTIIISGLVLLAISHGITKSTGWLKFSKEDEIAAVFCGTKKTLAAGIPMAKIIFAGDPALGMLLLPIMIYHPIQIFYCAVLANRYAKRPQLDNN